ncbi:EamA family transporter [Sphingobium lignivorans]|uniref:Drug/metabolite transporter (DMT)-like permease n=1 Tax=Sphingobium lignivorans TaxID=2735886 RepID=A0ABR6NL16_9SPHN|nr:drug/metabolite transporter (DMT)-like permease [Sphingobium lignivorans]
MSKAPSASGIILPFATVTLIWSSTWIVIRDQLAIVPPGWSVCYRFALAALGMAMVARLSGASLAIDRRAMLFAAALGLTQFAFNFNLLYRAEVFLTSGLCALVYALLMIPNSLLARIFFGERVTGGFVLGSAVAIAGIALLFLNEYRTSVMATPAQVLLGFGICVIAVMFASVSNVMQAAPLARTVPMASLLTWAMAIGAAADAVWAWITTGPPVIDPRPAYWLGVAYLAIAGSVITFPLYFRLIQRIGAGPAAYSSVLVPILAMGLSTLFEGYRWTALAIAGVLLALGGMVIALRARFRGKARR